MIEFRQAGVTYPGAADPALTGVSFSVAPGELVAVLGANGSGKSTLARLANALLVPDDGAVTVDGLDTRDEAHVWEIRAKVGFVQQNPENQIVGTVAEEDVAFGPENLGVPLPELRQRVDRALAAVGLTGLERREPHLLSEGQKQRLAIAGSLALEPRYLVLDEPTAMLDAGGRADVLGVLRALRATGVGMLYVTHHLEEVAEADRVVVLAAGTPAFVGPLADLTADPSRTETLGVQVPEVTALFAALAARGVSGDPGRFDAEAVVEALWPS